MGALVEGLFMAGEETYTPLVFLRQGGDELVIKSGGKITDDGTQASHIANATGGTYSTGVEAKINGILTALEGVGILATS